MNGIIPKADDFQYSQIELGYDGKLYFPAKTLNRIASFSNPDNPASGVWDDNAILITLPSNAFGINPITDQIDGEDYLNIFNATAECCNFNAVWDQLDFIAPTGSHTWDLSNPLNNGSSIARIKGTLHIPSGSHITIQNMELRFGLDGKIRIEPDASLTIDGTKLTGNANCSNMWLGVEVIGTGITGLPDQIEQGQFISQNHSIIEQAIVGVINGNFNTNLTNEYGGFISCTQTTFNNCHFGIKMWNRNKNAEYTSEINSCTFTGSTSWQPYSSIRPVEHVALVDVIGGHSSLPGIDIVFRNTYGRNTFINADYGVGCLNTRNIILNFADFTGCGTGIWAGIANSVNPSASKFEYLVFEDCHTSIRLMNTNGDIIGDNVFNRFSNPQHLNFFGVFAEGARGFKIVDNTFNRMRYGVWCNNSGSVGGSISSNNGGNIFNECWRGIDCRGDNQNLQIKCNTFNNVNQPGNEFSTAWYIGGDLGDQGSTGCPTCPAGNVFFRAPGRMDLYAEPGVPSTQCPATNFCYFRNSQPPSVIPLLYTPVTIFVDDTQIPKTASSCVGQQMMAMAGNDPGLAQNIITSEQDQIKQQLMVNELIAWYQVEAMEVEAIDYLEQRNDEASKKLLLPLYLKEGEISNARMLLNEHCLKNDDESQTYCHLNTMLIDWYDNGLSPFYMTYSERLILEEIANGLTTSAAQAQALLKMVYEAEIEVWHPSDTGNARMARPDHYQTDLPRIRIHPNPSQNGRITLSATTSFEDKTEALIRIYDMKSQLIEDRYLEFDPEKSLELNYENLPKGIYVFEFILKGYPSIHQKMIIQ